MKIYEKPKSSLENQTFAFASDVAKNGAEREQLAVYVSRDIGEVAVHDMYPQYVAFMRENRKDTRRDAIGWREDLNMHYNATFRDGVRELQNELANTPQQRHEAFLGAGRMAEAYALRVQGAEYVVRMLQHGTDNKVANQSEIDQYVANAESSRGLPHFEQIVAASYDDEVTVAERIPGEKLSHMGVSDIKAITDGQMKDMIHSLQLAYDHGINIDAIGGNVLYDRDHGFGFIDVAVAHPMTLGTGVKIAQVASLFESMGAQSTEYAMTGGSGLGSMIMYQIREKTAVLDRLKGVILHERSLTEDDKHIAIREIDARVLALNEELAWHEQHALKQTPNIELPTYGPSVLAGYDPVTGANIDGKKL